MSRERVGHQLTLYARGAMARPSLVLNQRRPSMLNVSARAELKLKLDKVEDKNSTEWKLLSGQVGEVDARMRSIMSLPDAELFEDRDEEFDWLGISVNVCTNL